MGAMVIIIGSIGAALAGYLLGKQEPFLMAGCLTILWLAVYTAVGLRIPRKKEFLVIERLGKFYRIAHRGPTVLCLPGLIDRIAKKDNLKLKRLDLYKDEPGNKIDYKDGSAATTIQGWWRISGYDSEEKELKEFDEENGEDRIKINKDIFLFTYAVENPEGRIEEVLDAFARPLLQKMTIDEANIKKNKVSTTTLANKGVKKAMRAMGVCLDPNKGVLITDIALPDEIVKLRELKMEGVKDAERAKARGTGYAQAINAIVEEAKNAGQEISFQDAQGIFERQRGLETVADTGANISFVASDIGGVMKTLDIKPSPKPSAKKEKEA